ncbi:MAG: GtrA family protein [Anaerolineales bacterium]
MTDARERARFLRFAIVGTIGAVVDFGVFNLLISVFNIVPVWANVCSFAVAVISNFVWNRYWTYPDSRSKKLRRQLLEFFVVNAIGVLIRTPIFAFMEYPLRGMFTRFPFTLPVSAEFLGHNMALATAMVVVLFWNFFVNRYWTYADVK